MLNPGQKTAIPHRITRLWRLWLRFELLCRLAAHFQVLGYHTNLPQWYLGKIANFDLVMGQIFVDFSHNNLPP
jgi:hypothetical protein